MKIEYEEIDGVAVAIIWRGSPRAQTEKCPFCDCSHKHGQEDGRRYTHCIPVWHRGEMVPPRDFVVAHDQKILFREHGYFVKTMQRPQEATMFK